MILDKDPTEILGALALLQSEEVPTLRYVLTKCPKLAESDWVNRWGPIEAWIRTKVIGPVRVRILPTVEAAK
jgi:hypothetical protein